MRVSLLCRTFANKQSFITTLQSTIMSIKKTSTLLGFTLLLSLCAVLSSCNKDEKLSNRISGKWEGDWGMSYEDREGVNHHSHHSIVEFYSDGLNETQGSGYQEDYYVDGPFTKLGFYFEWSINHKIIYINYPGYPHLNCAIRDYAMKKKHFTGYIGNTPFDLHNLEKDYKWWNYTARYIATGAAVLLWMADGTYLYYDDYYATRSASDGMLDDLGKPAGDMMPRRIYNRFAEQE